MLERHNAHFIWFQGQPPQNYNENIIEFKKKNPNFRINLWDEKSILKIIKRNPVFLMAYQKSRYLIQKVDIAKYAILYYYGGIYLDLDIQVNQPIHSEFIRSLDRNTLYFNWMQVYSFLPFIRVINNGIIISLEPMNQNILQIVNDIDWISHQGKNKDWYILETTGPFYLTRWIKKRDNPKIKVLDQKYFEGRPLIQFFTNSHGVFTTHLHHSNWMENWLYIYISLLRLTICLAIFITIYYLITKLFKMMF